MNAAREARQHGSRGAAVPARTTILSYGEVRKSVPQKIPSFLALSGGVRFPEGMGDRCRNCIRAT